MIINKAIKLLIKHSGEVHQGNYYSMTFVCNRKITREMGKAIGQNKK